MKNKVIEIMPGQEFEFKEEDVVFLIKNKSKEEREITIEIK